MAQTTFSNVHPQKTPGNTMEVQEQLKFAKNKSLQTNGPILYWLFHKKTSQRTATKDKSSQFQFVILDVNFSILPVSFLTLDVFSS